MQLKFKDQSFCFSFIWKVRSATGIELPSRQFPASTSSQPTQRQTRGPTWMHGDWNPGGGRLHIVPNELNQTVEGHTPLASHLGVLARDGSLLPLTYKCWHYVPKENKERIWREIKGCFQAQMQEQFQLYRAQFETQMKEMMETQMAAMRTQMDATIQAQAATIQAQQTRMEHLESQLLTRGGPAAREAAWSHHPMSRPQQNSHEFTFSLSHQKVAQSKTKNKSKSNRRHHI